MDTAYFELNRVGFGAQLPYQNMDQLPLTNRTYQFVIDCCFQLIQAMVFFSQMDSSQK